MTKIYDFDPNYYWLISELVRPIKNDEEFEKFTGIIYYNFDDIINTIDHDKLNYTDLINFYNNKINDLIETDPKGQDPYYVDEIKYYKIILNSIKNNKDFIKAIISLLLDGSLAYGDLIPYNHWGKTTDGRIVLLDYGLTENIYDTHYYQKSNAGFGTTRTSATTS